MIGLYIFLGLLGMFLLFLLGGMIYGYRITFYASSKKTPFSGIVDDSEQYTSSKSTIKRLINSLNEKEFEEIHLRSYDGTMLYARYYHIKDGAPVHIQFHGYRGSAVRDFCGGAALAMNKGHNVILVDQRAHGKSSGHTITFGIKERYDCVCFANYACERFGDKTPIFLSGISMGATTVLMASELGLPSSVCGIIADCPFSSPGGIIKSTIVRMKIPKLLMPYTATFLGGMLFGGFRLNASSPLKAVKNTSIPIMLFHGTADTIVPYEMGKEIFDCARSEKKFFYTFEGADHGMCYMQDAQKYEKAFYDFTELCTNDFENKILNIKE